MADSFAASWPIVALRRTAEKTVDAASRNVRLTAVLAVALIFVCFAAVTVLQVRRDYANALNMSEAFVASQANTLAGETGRSLDRLAALGKAYIAAIDENSAEDVIAASESDRILNIALTDADGRPVAAMKGQPLAARMLPEAAVRRAAAGNSIETYSDPAIGSSPLTLFFRADNETPPRFILMPIDPVSLLPKSGLAAGALFAGNGATLALGSGWDTPPPAYVLRSQPGQTALRYVDDSGVRRIIALAAVPGWPLTAAASVRASDALGAWYGSLPLYLFVILGPAVISAGLAFLLVREIERASRAASAPALVPPAMRETAPPPGAAETALLARLAETERLAREAERAKMEFLAHMSHELRTPLNAIIGFAEIIETGLFGPAGHAKYTEYARDIADAGRGLHNRIGDILEFTTVEAGRFPIAADAVDVCAVARACASQAQGTCLGRNVTLETRLPDLPFARADATAVKRILTILLSNALRYVPEGAIICIEARMAEGAIVLAVRDNGFGFSPEEAARAGTPFMRFARPDGEGGMGLGLAMAMALARRMGGALRLAGAAGEGTWAELRLPGL